MTKETNRYSDLEVINGLVDLDGNRIGTQWFEDLLSSRKVGIIDAINGGGKEVIAQQGIKYMRRRASVRNWEDLYIARVSIDNFIVSVREDFGLPRPIEKKEDFDFVTQCWYSGIVGMRNQLADGGTDFRILADIVGRKENLGRWGLVNLIQYFQSIGSTNDLSIMRVIGDPDNQARASVERNEAEVATNAANFLKSHGYICDPQYAESVVEQIKKSAPSQVIPQVSESISHQVANDYYQNFYYSEGENEGVQAGEPWFVSTPRKIKLPRVFADASLRKKRILQEMASYVIDTTELMDVPEGMVTIVYNPNLGERRKIHLFPEVIAEVHNFNLPLLDYPNPPDIDDVA